MKIVSLSSPLRSALLTVKNQSPGTQTLPLTADIDLHDPDPEAFKRAKERSSTWASPRARSQSAMPSASRTFVTREEPRAEGRHVI
ncbi:hypothetical protein EYF80_043757 [Liparis tanakae]|uniref:Uncharacterized protein n=1 Tax=Liparis tanakae TaxID=230148 RepID=A0A4Z2FXM6_9TELE|nr:hypothetical protein EYF80_043757 [Liparis tanakae]